MTAVDAILGGIDASCQQFSDAEDAPEARGDLLVVLGTGFVMQ